MTRDELQIITENDFVSAIKLLLYYPPKSKYTEYKKNHNFDTGISDEAIDFCIENFDGSIGSYYSKQIAMIYFANRSVEETCKALNITESNFKTQMSRFIASIRAAYEFYQKYKTSRHIPMEYIDRKLAFYLKMLNKIKKNPEVIPYLDESIEKVYDVDSPTLGFMVPEIYLYRNGVLILSSLNHDLGRWNRLKYYIGKDHPFFENAYILFKQRPYKVI